MTDDRIRQIELGNYLPFHSDYIKIATGKFLSKEYEA
jgi:hypothetical protein